MTKINISTFLPKQHFFLVIMVVAVLLMNLETFFMPVGTDQGMFYHIGQQIAQGKLPYRDAWEHKPPVAFYLFAAVLKISNTHTSLIILNILCALFSAWGMYLLAKQFFTERQAQLATLLFILVSNAHRLAQGGNHTEAFMALFLIFAYYFFIVAKQQKYSPRYLLYSGIFLGISFQAKPVAVFSMLGVALFFIYDAWCLKLSWSRAVGSLFYYGLGLALPNIMLLAYFFSQGILKDFIELNYLFNARYATTNWGNTELLLWLKETLVDLAVSGLFLWVLVAIAWGQVLAKIKAQPLVVFAYVVFIFDLLGVSAGAKFFGHYWLQVLPLATILAMLGYETVAKNKYLRLGLISLIVLACVAQVFFTGKQIYKKYIVQVPDYDQLIGQYIRQHSDPTARIYINGLHPEIAFHADRALVWNVETDIIHRRLPAAGRERYENIFKQTPPLYVVVSEPYSFTWQKAYIEGNYVVEKTWPGFYLYRRK